LAYSTAYTRISFAFNYQKMLRVISNKCNYDVTSSYRR